MSAEAKVSMLFPPSGLEPTELDRVKRLDGAVARVLIAIGITNRATWEGRSEGGRRVLALRLLTAHARRVIELSASEFASLTDDQLLARVERAARVV